MPGAAYVPRGVPLAAAYGVLAKNQFGLRNAGGVGATPPTASHCVVRAPSVLRVSPRVFEGLLPRTLRVAAARPSGCIDVPVLPQERAEARRGGVSDARPKFTVHATAALPRTLSDAVD